MKIFVLLSCFIVIACGNSNANIQTLEFRDNVRDVNLKKIEGEMDSLDNYSDARDFMVILEANNCPCAIVSKDRFIAWGNKYNSKGYPVIVITKSAGPFFCRHFI